jgi:hypothetical protein
VSLAEGIAAGVCVGFALGAIFTAALFHVRGM